MVAAIAHAAAREYRFVVFLEEEDYEAPPDTPQNNNANTDTLRNLRFPIYDNTGDPAVDRNPGSIDLNDPSNYEREVEYDPATDRYYFMEKVGERYVRTPTYMTRDEYQRFQAKQAEDAYWKRRLDALSLFNKKPQLPTMYKEGIFDRIFGGDQISVRPQGNVDVTFGGNWQNIKNPTLVQRAQKYGVFDFDLQMNINLLATVGDKLKFNISNNTKATFDYQNIQRLEYTGKEDEIIKKIEAGNVSFPVKSTLISGRQSLFGLKTQLQFGKLWVTGVVSQQKSKVQNLTVQGGSQTQQFSIKADDYEESRHFLLAQYFVNNYDRALQNYPIINSQVTLNKVEVWVTNSTGATDGVRDILAFMDLGEADPFNNTLAGATQPIPNGLPDNRINNLYDRLQQDPSARLQGNAVTAAQRVTGNPQGQGPEFEKTTARKLSPSEYTFNTQLGYISLNTQLNPADILAVAYRYTYNGKVYQVGEFSEDLPPDAGSQAGAGTGGTTTPPATNQKVLFMKMLKGTSLRPTLPIWNLMMKNVYALGGIGVSKDDFRLNVLYQDPGGGEKRYLPVNDGPAAGVPLLTLLNLDRLNYQNDPAPDGIFDFVDGVTINTQQGKIIFPVLEPFGGSLQPKLGGNVQDERRYLYQILYDSTKTIARQFQQQNRYVIKGSYRSASSSEIFLGGFNIPQGSVIVSAGGQALVENVDYQIDYGLGRLKILNSGILNSGIPINVQYEDNATFGFQQQNFMGARADYYVNDQLAIGATFMRLTERPFTQKTTFGEDPIRNTVLGADVNYQSEFPGLTRLLDKLPVYSTTAPSFITVNAEVAGLFPGHPKQINALDPEGAVYIDDFEGARSSYDLKFPANAWTLATTPVGAVDRNNNILFPEATLNNNLQYGRNRARLAWYFIEPTLVDGNGTVPDFVKQDPNQHYIRLVQQQEVFPQKNYTTFQNALSTLDLAFYPHERGPYNFDATNIEPDGRLSDPQTRWGGIMRSIDNSDFEQSNVEFIEFWVMDPFINNPTATGGSLYINLGNVSEDVLKDSRKFFENGLPYPKNNTLLDPTNWGFVPKFEQQITRAFDNDPAARSVQDVGYDGMDNEEERGKFAAFLAQVAAAAPGAASALNDDPASDNYHYFRGQDYDNQNLGILGRYKFFNNPHGNSPVSDASSATVSSATNIPESEDINRDNTLNEAEDYYQYRIDFTPNMQVGSNYIINKQETVVKLPNGNSEPETWYQFKIPIREYQNKVGSIADFRSIRFMRLFLNGFQDSVVMRFARLELGRNQWRRYQFSLQTPGENIPEEDLRNVEFAVTSVSLEENSDREPVPYVIPPGVDRQQQQVATGQSIQLNEQALSLQVCGLKDGDARAAFKEVTVDMRQFSRLRMFMHAESRVGQTPLNNGDVRGIIRIGSDFTNNYYEYQVPLTITQPGANTPDGVWPEANLVDLELEELVRVKTERNSKGLPSFAPYQVTDAKGNTIVVVGNPNVGEAKTIMVGILNPKRSNNSNPPDDGLPKCAEVWFNELRMAGLDEKPGYAAAGKVNLQLADLGNLNFAGSMHTQGYGSIDQKVNDRFRDNFYQYNTSTNLNMGKLMPRKWGVQLPIFVGYAENISNPEYDPYDLDVKFRDKVSSAPAGDVRDSVRKAAQDYTSITSVNASNIRITGDPDKASATVQPWSAKNFDLSYAYNRQFKRNPVIKSDELINQRLGLGYSYNIRSEFIEPFKKIIKSRSKWLALIKDINFKPLPANFNFRTELNRTVNETQVRNVGDGDFAIQPTYFKNFLWMRTYGTRWELTRSLALDYQATNNSRVDEPYGRIDNAEKRDSLWDNVKRLGRNTFYTQSFNATYNLPLSKLPLTDWTSLRLQYGSTYSWTAASQLARDLGNTIGNTQNKQLNAEFNFTQLYNKNRYLRAINQPKPRKNNNQPTSQVQGSNPLSPGAKNNITDLRKNRPPAGNTQPQPTTEEEQAPPPATANAPAKPQQPVTPPKTTRQVFDSTRKAMDIVARAAGMSDQQLDSMHKVQDARLAAQLKAEKEKRKRERKLARQKKRNTIPQVGDGIRVVGRVVTMLKRATVSYGETAGTILPGWLDSTRYMGINNYTLQPGLDFVYGMQPNRTWLETKAEQDLLSTDTLFNAQYQQQYQQNLNLTATVEPFRDFRIDFSLTSSFSKSHNELFKDTSFGRTGVFTHNNPYETGSFNISYIGLKTLFQPSGANSATYQTFLTNRTVVSQRLGDDNPYTGNVPDPNDPNYQKGYTRYSQDVLIPSFVAAYSGRDPNAVGLVDYSNSTIKSNPFKNFFPLPNWRIAYNGLSKVAPFNDVFTNLVINHAYTGSLSMNSFVSALFYEDIYSLGFPSFIDSNSGNFVPFFQVPNITITEQLNPFIGIDASFKNSLTARFEYRKSRTVSLSMIDYQVSETNSTEYIVGLGYRIKGLNLPIAILGVRRLPNDINMKVDIGIRDDRSSNNYLAQNIEVTTRGQKVISISPTIDYIASDKLTVRIFYDRRQSIPYVTSSYPITTTRAGITLRFIFAQ